MCIRDRSEGKDNKGLFPASVVFSTDLHSMGQYLSLIHIWPITPEVPASILQVHPDVTIVGDEEAMSVIREKCPEMIY